MEKIAKENLFLLEFLVDKCVINPEAITKEIAKNDGETCVCFKFLDNDPLDVCEADFSPKSDYTQEDNGMKSGKSCLFALTPVQAEEASKSFNIDVSVFKKMPNDAMPDKVQIGTATIPVVSIFNEIIALLQSGAKSETVSRTLKDAFDVKDPKDEVVGNISAFIRMSCFGKLIVTQFQMNLKDKSVFFKDNEGKSLYKYRKATKGENKRQGRTEDNDEDDEEGGGTLYCTPTGRKLDAKDGKYGGDDGEYPECNPEGYLECPAFGGRKPNTKGSQDPRKQRNYNMEKRYSTTLNKRDSRYNTHMNTDQSRYDSYGMRNEYPDNYAVEPRGLGETKGPYQEIGAEMNGNAIKLRIPKGKGKIKRLDADDPSEDGYSQSYPSLPSSNHHGCCCSHTMRGKQMLTLRPADDPKNPFGFKVSGCPNGANNITVIPPTNTRPDGMQVTEISDPNKDIFVLRIGKKSEGNDQKSNLELELVTPKAVDRKPPPKLETRETQYVESDIGPAPDQKASTKGAKGGKGGKAGKGGKGGKGGKKGKK